VSSDVCCANVGSASIHPIRQLLRSRWPVEKLERPFWVFFAAAFFLDFGFDLYFFLYNLFLLNLHYDERAIGFISSALTVGNLAGSIPVGILARRFGLQRPLIFCFLVAPLISIFRTAIMWIPGQIVLAFLTGVALSAWPVCFAPTVAKLTTDETRIFAFSITFATGIGTGTLAGLAGGYVPQMFHRANTLGSPVNGMRFVLIGAAVIALIGAWPISRLRISDPLAPSQHSKPFFLHPYLLKFLPAFAIWSIVTGSFAPFAPIFFQKQLGFSLQHVGGIFSASELVQFCAVLLVPFLFRAIGITAGMLAAQLTAGVSIFLLGSVHSPGYAVAWFLTFSGAQFTVGPGFYGMLMSRIPETERSRASAIQNIAGALSQAGASTLTGISIVRFGYGAVCTGIAVLTFLAGMVVLTCLSPPRKPLGRSSSEITSLIGS
jgi:MFS family permease